MCACSEIYMRAQHYSLVVDLILVYEMLKGCTIRKHCGGRVVPTGLVWHSMHDAKLLQNVSFFTRDF